MGFMCKWQGAEQFKDERLGEGAGKIGIEYQKDYHGEGPVLYGEAVEPAREIKDIVQF